MNSFDWKDYTLVALSLAITCLIGIYHGFFKKSNNLADYLFGGNNMSIFPISLSLIASYVSTTALIGVTTETYSYGTQYLIAKLFSFLAMSIILVSIYVPLYQRLKLNSLFQYLELRFDRKVKLLASIMFVIGRLSFIPTVIYGASVSMNRATGVDIFIQNVILMSFCVFYTALGGFKGVVWSDVLQTFLMFISLVIMVVVGFIKIDGISNMINTSLNGQRLIFFDMDLDPTKRTSFLLVFFGMFFTISSNFTFNPEGYQRIVSVNSEKKATTAVIIYAIGASCFSILCGFLGLIAYSYYVHCDPYKSGIIANIDQIFLHFVMDIGSGIGGLPGLFLLALVSVSLSTVSTFLNATAGTIFTDFMQPYMSVSELNASRIVKFNVVLIGIVSVAVTPSFKYLGNILDILISFQGISTGINCALFYAAALLPCVNAKGAFYGGITGLIIMSWIGMGSLNAKLKGHITFEMLPLSTDSCPFNTTIRTINHATNTTRPYVFPVYRLSNYSFGLIGCITTLAVCLIVSLLTGSNKSVKLDEKLFATYIKKCLPKKEEYIGVKTEDTPI